MLEDISTSKQDFPIRNAEEPSVCEEVERGQSSPKEAVPKQVCELKVKLLKVFDD